MLYQVKPILCSHWRETERTRSAMATTLSLLDLSHEVLHSIFTFIEPADLASLNRSCRALNAYIDSNHLLCKELYLQRWVQSSKPVNITTYPNDVQDYPSGDKEPLWEDLIRKNVTLQKVLQSQNLDAKVSTIYARRKHTATKISQYSERTLSSWPQIFCHCSTAPTPPKM